MLQWGTLFRFEVKITYKLIGKYNQLNLIC